MCTHAQRITSNHARCVPKLIVKKTPKLIVKNLSQKSVQKHCEYFCEYFLLDFRDLKIFTIFFTTVFWYTK
jgi:hypothetical protein